MKTTNMPKKKLSLSNAKFSGNFGWFAALSVSIATIAIFAANFPS
jgi:hypothetical protein